MDRKFFFFRREPESETSASLSDTGVGLSTIAIPSENLTFITAGKKRVTFTFKDCNGFEDSLLLEGESIPKANITVSCKEGEESSLIESVINFLSRSTPKNIMKFDVVDGESTFNQAVVDSVGDVISVVPANPVNTFTGEVSLGDEQTKFQNTIADITFPGELPVLDFNHELISGIAEGGGSISSIVNAGTAAVDTGDFNFANSGVFGPSDDDTLKEKAVTIGSGGLFRLNSDYNVTSEDYTIYIAANHITGVGSALYGIGSVYSDTAGECFGFGGRFKNNGTINSSDDELIERTDVFSVRHAGITGTAPFASTVSSEDGTKSIRIPDPNTSASNYNPNHVFIIRRDKNYNMFLHDRNGDIISRIPSKTNIDDPSLVASSPNRTDGDLVFKAVGTPRNNISKFYLYRFGIIKGDIGANNAANLAKQLYRFYGTK
jgi:hypothetical protein